MFVCLPSLAQKYHQFRNIKLFSTDSTVGPSERPLTAGPLCITQPAQPIALLYATGTHIFSVRVINVWNSLPADRVDFSSFAAFKQTIEQIDFSQFLFGYDN